jgi:formylmethanofuran dehydrogenase subunit E
MLSQPPEHLFRIEEETAAAMPGKARIHESAVCDLCGERVMLTRVRRRGDRTLCIPCDARRRDDC